MRITGPTTTSIGWWSWARPILTCSVAPVLAAAQSLMPGFV